MPPPPDGLLEGQGLDGLVAASGGSRFVRHYAFVDDNPTWYAVPGAVGFSGSSLSGHLPGHLSCHLSWTLIGDGAGVARLLQRLAEGGRHDEVDVLAEPSGPSGTHSAPTLPGRQALRRQRRSS